MFDIYTVKFTLEAYKVFVFSIPDMKHSRPQKNCPENNFIKFF